MTTTMLRAERKGEQLRTHPARRSTSGNAVLLPVVQQADLMLMMMMMMTTGITAVVVAASPISMIMRGVLGTGIVAKMCGVTMRMGRRDTGLFLAEEEGAERSIPIGMRDGIVEGILAPDGMTMTSITTVSIGAAGDTRIGIVLDGIITIIIRVRAIDTVAAVSRIGRMRAGLGDMAMVMVGVAKITKLPSSSKGGAS